MFSRLKNPVSTAFGSAIRGTAVTGNCIAVVALIQRAAGSSHIHNAVSAKFQNACAAAAIPVCSIPIITAFAGVDSAIRTIRLAGTIIRPLTIFTGCASVLRIRLVAFFLVFRFKNAVVAGRGRRGALTGRRIAILSLRAAGIIGLFMGTARGVVTGAAVTALAAAVTAVGIGVITNTLDFFGAALPADTAGGAGAVIASFGRRLHD